MSSPPPSPAVGSPAEAAFVAALAAGLPASHDWSFPGIVAVSGGADSVALLLGLIRLVPAPSSRLVVAHADHGLRAGSADDLEFVRGLAVSHGLGFVGRRLDVAGDRGGEGLEGRARRLRYAFLSDVAHEIGARHVMVAHTADDQAETVLHRILRGTGLAGLAGMSPARMLADGVALLRPLLGVSRGEVRRFLGAAGQAWREDPTNADPARARNLLRHDVLPRCVAGQYPAASQALVRLASQAAASAGALASAAGHLLDSHSERHPDGTIVLRTRPLAGLDPHLVAEIFAALWRREGWPRRDMTAEHYATLASLAACAEKRAAGTVIPGRQFPGGIEVRACQPGRLVVSGP